MKKGDYFTNPEGYIAVNTIRLRQPGNPYLRETCTRCGTVASLRAADTSRWYCPDCLPTKESSNAHWARAISSGAPCKWARFRDGLMCAAKMNGTDRLAAWVLGLAEEALRSAGIDEMELTKEPEGRHERKRTD